MSQQINWAWYIPPQVGIPALALSDPGMGKTSAAKNIADKVARHFVAFLLDQCLPEDIGGTPVLAELKDIPLSQLQGIDLEELGAMKCTLRVPDAALARMHAASSLALFDELTNAPRPNQAAALEIIHEPPPGCWLYAAANPLSSAANSTSISAPLANRMWIGEYQMDVAGWHRAMQNVGDDGVIPYGKHMQADFPLVTTNYRMFVSFWAEAVSEYLVRHPNLLAKCPKETTKQGQPWPSPRQWEHVAIVMAACDDVHGNAQTRLELASGLVGADLAASFLDSVSNISLPDAEVIIGDGWQLPEEPSAAVGCLRKAHHYYQDRITKARSEKTAAEWWERYQDFVLRVFRQKQDYGMLIDLQAMRVKPDGHTPRERGDDDNWTAMRKMQAICG